MNDNLPDDLEISLSIYPYRFVRRYWAAAILFFILMLGLAARIYFFTGINCATDIFYLFDIRSIFDRTFTPGGIYSSRIGHIYPLYYLMSFFGRTELVAGAWMIFCGLAEICMIYHIGKMLFSKQVGLWAAFLLSIYPAHIIGSSRIVPDVTLSLCLTTSFYFFAAANFRKDISHSQVSRFNFISGIMLYAGFLVKPQAIILIPAYLLICLFRLYGKTLKIRNVAFMFAGLLTGLVFEIIFYRMHGQPFLRHYAELFSFFSRGAAQSSDMLVYPLYFLNRVSSIPVVDYSPGTVFYVVLPLVVYALWKKRSAQALWLFLWFSGVFLFMTFGSQGAHNFVLANKESRFALYYTVPLFVLAAAAIPHLSRNLRFILVVFVLLSSFHFASESADWWNYEGGPCACRKNDIRLIYKNLKTRQDLSTWTRKPVYIDDGFGHYLLDFYSGYQWDLRSIPQNKNPMSIRDSYVILDVSAHQAFPSKEDVAKQKYPSYVFSPPESWVLLDTVLDVSDMNERTYNPKIYYSPATDNDN